MGQSGEFRCFSAVQHPDGLGIEAVSESASAGSDALISSARWQRGEYIMTGMTWVR